MLKCVQERVFDALKCSNVAIGGSLDANIVAGRWCRTLYQEHYWDIAVSSSSCVFVGFVWFQKDFGTAISDPGAPLKLYRIATGPGRRNKA